MNYRKGIILGLSLGFAGLALAGISYAGTNSSQTKEINFIDFASEQAKVCHHGGEEYSQGSVICLSGRDHKCNSRGKWTALGTTSSCR